MNQESLLDTPPGYYQTTPVLLHVGTDTFIALTFIGDQEGYLKYFKSYFLTGSLSKKKILKMFPKVFSVIFSHGFSNRQVIVKIFTSFLTVSCPRNRRWAGKL